MKKFLYSLLTLAAALTVASCQQELEGGSVYDDGTTVDATFAVNLGPQTKAFADGTTVDQLYAGIYEITGTDTYAHVTHTESPAAISGKAGEVSFTGKIKRGHSYKIVFWAQKEGAPYALAWDDAAPTVTVTATGNANDESRDAFYGEYLTGEVTGSITVAENEAVQLKRPFAQVNVLVPADNIAAYTSLKSSMTVENAPTVLNLATKATSVPALWSFALADMAEPAFGDYAKDNKYKYVAMNYVLVDQTVADPHYNVAFRVKTNVEDTGETLKSVANTPLKPNGRTNIVGNIFADDFDITVPVIITPGPGSEQVVTQVTVAVGQTAAEAQVLTYDPNAQTQKPTVINVAINHPITKVEDAPTFTYNPEDKVTAVWVIDDVDLGTGHINVTPLVADALVEITATFPAVTKAVYSPQTAKFYVKVGSGVNPTPQVATPTFTPAGGEYTEAQNVTIACETEGASIYYTTDGSDPNTSSTPYTSAIAVNATTTIKAIAVKEDMTNSEIATAAYTINIPAEPDFTTIAGLKALLGAESDTFTGTLTDAVVTFIAGTSDAVIKDASGSILYHKDTGHGLLQGQTISGDVTVDGVIYNGINEITSLTATVEGTGSAVEPQVVTLAQLAADYATYESAYVKVVGVTSKTTTTAKGNISVTQDATNYIVYTNVAIPVNTGDIFTAEGTVTKYNMTEELKVWKSADLTVTTPAPVLSATPATKTVNADVTSVTWNITSNTDWTITTGSGVTASSASGNGDKEVTLTFDKNTTNEAKTLTATVKAEGCEDVTITITQNGTGTVVTKVTVWDDDFSNLTAASTSAMTSLNGSKTGFTSAYSGVSTVYPEVSAIKLASGSKTGSITTPAFSALTSTSTVTVTLEIAGMNAKTGNLTITVNNGGTPSVTSVDFTASSQANASGVTDWQEKSFTISNATSATTLTISAASGKQCFINSILIETE